MTAFPKPVLDYWNQRLGADHAFARSRLSCAISTRLSPTRPAMMLETVDGSVRAVVRPEIAEQAGITDSDGFSADDLKSRFRRAGVTLRDPDYLFYLSSDTHRGPDFVEELRQLNDADRAAFNVFYNEASEQDR